MNKDKRNNIKLLGTLNNADESGIIANASQIYDDVQQKAQETINSELIAAVGTGGSVDTRITKAVNVEKTRAEGAESTLDGKITAEQTRAANAESALDGRVDTLEEAVGTGGSVDSRIASAVATETSRAQEAEANRYTKNEIYTKEEVNNLITTPNQEYISVTATEQTTVVTDVLPATGAADTTYRVGNWDGTQYNDSVFSEYAWNGSAYIKLSTKSQVGEVYDISANHADTKYADLAAALGTNGKNIPQSLRKGGMSVKFVQSSDNKYVQYRLMSDSFGTIESDWQNIGLVQQIGLSETVAMSQKAVTEALKEMNTSGFSKTPYISHPLIGFMYELMIHVKSGDKYHYQGTVDNGRWGITIYSDTALTVVSKTLVPGKGTEKIDVEGVFEQDGWGVVYNRNFSNFGLLEVFKPISSITSENNVEDLNNAISTEYDIKGNTWVNKQFAVRKGDILSIAATGDKGELLRITSTEDNSKIFTIPFVKKKNIVNIEAPFDGMAKVSNRNYDSTLSSCIVTEKEKFLTSQNTNKERVHFVFPQTSLDWDKKSFDVFAGEIVKGFLYGDKSHPNAVTLTAKNGEEKVLLVFDEAYINTPFQFSYNITEDGILTLQNRSFDGHLGEVHIESSIEQNISALQSGFNELSDKVKSATSYDFNVKAYGAKGDGIADDTDAIQAAIDACCKAGGGTVFIPNGIYRLHKVQSRTDGTYTKTGHLFIPVTSNLENRITLKIRGESAVQYTTFYVDSRMGTGVTGNKGATLYSDYLPEDTSKALDNPISVITSIGWTNGGIPQNVTIVKMESFNICTKCSDLGYPFVSGVDGSLMAQLDCRDMDIRTDGMVKNLKKSPTGHICFGMMVGASLDDPHQSLDYINISQGFNYGLISGLHLTARCIDIQTCINAFTFSKGGHFSEFSLVTIHHCANNIVCLDKEFDNVKIGATWVLFHLFNYETQVGMTPSDFGYQKAVVDPNNNIHGKCDYFLGWSATQGDRWTMDGGRYLQCTSL